MYSIEISGQITHILASHMGYETGIKSIKTESDEDGTFYLKQQILNLNEANISANAVYPYVSKTNYMVTDNMRKEFMNAFELLHAVPYLRIDRVNNTIKTGKDETVLLLVDGLQQSQDYIKDIPSERIMRIEIIYEPSGRFISENYSTIVNYILKNDYSGYNINIHNSTRINTVGTNGKNLIMTGQSGIDFNYTKQNFSVYSHYDFKETRMNLARYWFKQINEPNLSNYLRSKNVSMNNPNSIYAKYSNQLAAGISYMVNPFHTISLTGDYIRTKESSENIYLISNSPNYTSDVYSKNDTTTNKLKDNDYKGSLFYKGYLSENIQLYGEISYNRYSDNIDNFYRQDVFFEERNIFKERKKQLTFNFESDIRMSSRNSINTGYSFNRRQYGSDSSTGVQFIDYKETRNNLFIYLLSNPIDNLQVKVGTGIECINTKSIDYENKQLIFQPHIQLNYGVNKNIKINVSYKTNSENPGLTQLSIMPLVVDTIINQKGNPELKTSVNHILTTRFYYKNRFHFKAEFRYSPEAICETREKTEYRIYNTFDNIKIKEYYFQFDYKQPISDKIYWKNSAIYYASKAKFQNIHNYIDGWLFDSTFDYYQPRMDFGIQLGYHKGMSKQIIWQGYRMVNNDKWEITTKKLLLKKQVSIILSYIPPIDWGITYKQKRKIESSDFIENNDVNLKTFRNTLFLSVVFRFNKGKIQQNSGKYESGDNRRLNF